MRYAAVLIVAMLAAGAASIACPCRRCRRPLRRVIRIGRSPWQTPEGAYFAWLMEQP